MGYIDHAWEYRLTLDSFTEVNGRASAKELVVLVAGQPSGARAIFFWTSFSVISF